MPESRLTGQLSLEQSSEVVGREACVTQNGGQGSLLYLSMHRHDQHMPRAELLESHVAPAPTHDPPTIGLKRFDQAPTGYTG